MPGVSVITTAAEKPYYAKRPHRKSRTGCRNCKARKVKCDEGRPACRTCTVRKEKCVYTVAATPKPASSPTTTASSSPSPGNEPGPDLALVATHVATVPQQPLFKPSGRDEIDMRLLWFYTTATYTSFSTSGVKERDVDVVLKVNVVQHAFANPFLMDCILALSAMHINWLGVRSMGISRSQEIYYRAKAFETYRKAVAAADPATYQALLVCSLLLCGLSTHLFRGDEAKPLAILDWMILWKGIGQIIEVIKLPALFRSGIAALVFRPDADLNASAQCLPAYLLFMLASIREGDPEYPLVQAYYCALLYLGSLYLELKNGISQLLLLRIVTFPTRLPNTFIDAARAKRPGALVILAHYLVFVKFRVGSCWWLDNISAHEIPSIYNFLGPEWERLLHVPMAALQLDNDRDVARLLLDDSSWDKPTSTVELAIRAAMEDIANDPEALKKKTMEYGLFDPHIAGSPV
ncbi:hypothetical protein N657DRAFT_658157 [Parathielavia appendiculata]|uniref:Zn(2)-C6 fungal-type domain-containing protein n=1 Tax=Parathielavia appendiculata TaxID=2587402 RepID=A0AAN6Z1Q5_9PEZI|nr:hypothetical protein N657DRAFT_658157 [Parathielavia appendiculata]